MSAKKEEVEVKTKVLPKDVHIADDIKMLTMTTMQHEDEDFKELSQFVGKPKFNDNVEGFKSPLLLIRTSQVSASSSE